MKNQMLNQFGKLVSLNLDLNKFFSVNIGEYDISIIGFFEESQIIELKSKGFVQKDVLYKEDIAKLEYVLEDIRVTLVIRD
jgi:hypothetical protein